MATKKAKFGPADVKKHTARIQELAEELKKGRKKGDTENLTIITPEEIAQKLKRVNSPFIYFQSWGGASR